MKSYDFNGIKRYCQMHSDIIDTVVAGINEDWFWTAEEVYSEGKFKVEIDSPMLKIGGISGSSWATPTMLVTFKDGTETRKPAFIGESESQRPEWFSLGCLSGPIQAEIEGTSNLLLSSPYNERGEISHHD